MMGQKQRTTCYNVLLTGILRKCIWEDYTLRLYFLPAFNLRSLLFLSFYLESNQLRTQRIPGVYVLPAAKSPLSMYFVILVMDE